MIYLGSNKAGFKAVIWEGTALVVDYELAGILSYYTRVLPCMLRSLTTGREARDLNCRTDESQTRYYLLIITIPYSILLICNLPMTQGATKNSGELGAFSCCFVKIGRASCRERVS